MAIGIKIYRCTKNHQLWIRNGRDYFCKICGDIDIEELRRVVYKKIKSLRPGWLTRKFKL